jgi:predicted transposase YbfD/YdcC
MIFSTNKNLLVIFTLALLSILSGCQLLKKTTADITVESKIIDYTQYYLSLVTLTDSQLADKVRQHQLVLFDSNEAVTQNKMNNNDAIEWQLKSVLLFSLPHSSVHNPFTAKSILNKLSLIDLKNSDITEADFAFYSMLKIQLNEQVLRLNELSQAKKAFNAIKEASVQQQQQFKALQQQILQLKKIEHTINEHGQ